MDFLKGPLIKSWERAYFIGVLIIFFIAFYLIHDYAAVTLLIASTAVYYWGKPALEHHWEVKKSAPAREYLPLKIQLIPRSAWKNSFTNQITDVQWSRITEYLKEKNNYRCSICNKNHKNQPETLEAHEQWSFDITNNKQILEDIKCVCTKCHHVIHWGRSCNTYDSSYLKELKDHFYKVNYPVLAPRNAFQKEVLEAKELFENYSMYNYNLSADKGYKILADANDYFNKPHDNESDDEVYSDDDNDYNNNE